MPGRILSPGICQRVLFFDQTGFHQSLLDLGLVLIAGLHQRQTALACVPAQYIHRILDRDGVYLAEQSLAQGQHFQLQGAGPCRISLKPCLAAVVYQLRLDVGDHADNALAAQRQQGDHLIIIAGIEVQVIAAELRDLCYLRNVAGSLFQAVDERMLAQLRAVSGAMFRPVREGTLYRMTGMPPASAMAVK